MLPRQTGIGFANTLREETWLANRHYVNGSGVALGDVDGDDRPDIFLARLEGPNALYLNRGAWRFDEVAVMAGVDASEVATTGAALVDIDGDGDLDLLLTSLGAGTLAYENDGFGNFTDITVESGLGHRGGATTMALADVDGDRDLDLYVGYYKTHTIKDLYSPQELAFERVVRQQGDTYSIEAPFEAHYRLVRQGNRLMRFEVAEPDRFYLNDGRGHFSAVPLAGQAFRTENGQPVESVPEEWALTVRLQDFDGDGLPDLYVCNDFESPDHFWRGGWPRGIYGHTGCCGAKDQPVHHVCRCRRRECRRGYRYFSGRHAQLRLPPQTAPTSGHPSRSGRYRRPDNPAPDHAKHAADGQ